MSEAAQRTGRRIVETVRGYLEVLTPVHVGSGVKWQKDFDFVVDGAGTYVVPEPLLMNYLHDHPEAISRLEDHNARVELLWEIEGGMEYSLPCYSRDILAFLRDGNGQPFLPGSSLKGALRTVIFRQFWDQQNPERQQRLLNQLGQRREWAAQPLLRAVLGPNPNHDLLRVLAVRDVPLRQENLDLYRLFILSLTRPDGSQFGWRNIPRRQATNRIREATSVYAEMIKPGTRSSLSLRLDRFLLEDDRAERELHFRDKQLSLERLARWANRHARRLLEREQAFLEQCDDGQLQRLLDNIGKLLDVIPEQDTDEEGQCFLLRLGWSSGWQAMTGGYLSGEALRRVRGRYRLGKPQFPIFPKTRKIVFDGEEPAWLAGWIKIWLDADIQQAEQPASKENTRVKSSRPQIEITASEDVPEDYETGVVHNLKLNKGYGTILPDSGGEPIRFDFTTADMTGLEKGARVRFRLVKKENQYHAIDVKRIS